MSDNIVHTTDSSFEADVLQAEGPVLVDFWAEWCGPCKMIAPVLEELAGEYDGKLKICKMDVDANVETAPKYGVRGIPTLIVFNNGDVAGTKVGALSKSQLSHHPFLMLRTMLPSLSPDARTSRLGLACASLPSGRG